MKPISFILSLFLFGCTQAIPSPQPYFPVLSKTVKATDCQAGGVTTFTYKDKNVNGKYDENIDQIVETDTFCNEIMPTDIVAIVDPCGDSPGIIDEVFLRLKDRSLVASFSNNVNGDYTRFSILAPGNYQTTDGSNCFFTVDQDFNIINEHY